MNRSRPAKSDLTLEFSCVDHARGLDSQGHRIIQEIKLKRIWLDARPLFRFEQ